MRSATRPEQAAEVVDPAGLAETLWRMHTERAGAEERAGALAVS